MSHREFDFAAVEERTREVARQMPVGRDRFWRLDEALGEFVARETGIWQPGRTYTLLGPARKVHDLDLRVRRIETHLGLEPEDG
jgi:hypothetical protein